MPMYYDTIPTPVGPLSVAVDASGAVLAAAFGAPVALRLPAEQLSYDRRRLDHVSEQVEAYFAGTRRDFDLAVQPRGTPYQRRLWQALLEIPYGDTRSYAELAAQLGSSPRAIGGANGANPIVLIVPCHRVIGADGSLTGFAYGTEIKRRLLEHEARFARSASDLATAASA